jgi:hypothetical protein
MVVLAAISTVTAIVLVASASAAVLVPLGVVLATGLVTSGLAAMLDRWWLSRRRRAGAAPWGAVGGISVGLLVIAMLAPENARIALTAFGLAGLIAFRLAVLYGRWAPFGSVPAGLVSVPPGTGQSER